MMRMLKALKVRTPLGRSTCPSSKSSQETRWKMRGFALDPTKAQVARLIMLQRADLDNSACNRWLDVMAPVDLRY